MSPDGRFLFSAGADGSIFIFSVSEYTEGGMRIQDDDKMDDMSNSIVDKELADIVLVKKNEMEEW